MDSGVRRNDGDAASRRSAIFFIRAHRPAGPPMRAENAYDLAAASLARWRSVVTAVPPTPQLSVSTSSMMTKWWR
ncbi:conserved hypothetical protein, partial [Ricinus communis]